MLGPSPDWIVGVSGLELCKPNCSWVESKELFLYPWDSGVDSGISYESPDSPSEPKMPITRYITEKCSLIFISKRLKNTANLLNELTKDSFVCLSICEE